MNIPTPYLVFLGNAVDYKQAKVASGVVEWRPEHCLAQCTMDGCKVDLGLPEQTPAEAVSNGAKTFLIGISPFETELPESFKNKVLEAIGAGLNIANPLHAALPTEILEAAEAAGVKVFNFRHRTVDYPKGAGTRRPGLRLLTAGNDCACGKKYTALALYKTLTAAGDKATFRATGQTGFLISQSGINNDTIQADFLTGAAEWLTPANDPGHWDIVEGQGALSHPSFGPGSLGLIYGTQPDFVVMCTEPGRIFQRGVMRQAMPITNEGLHIEVMGRRTNPNLQIAAYSLFTRDASFQDIEEVVREVLTYNPNAIIFDPYYAMTGKPDRTPLINSVEGLARLVREMKALSKEQESY